MLSRGAGDGQEEALPVRRASLKGHQPPNPFAIRKVMLGPKDAQRSTRLLSLLDREAQLLNEGTHHAQPAAPMQAMAIREYNHPPRDRLQRETVEEKEVRMGLVSTSAISSPSRPSRLSELSSSSTPWSGQLLSQDNRQ